MPGPQYIKIMGSLSYNFLFFHLYKSILVFNLQLLNAIVDGFLAANSICEPFLSNKITHIYCVRLHYIVFLSF